MPTASSSNDGLVESCHRVLDSIGELEGLSELTQTVVPRFDVGGDRRAGCWGVLSAMAVLAISQTASSALTALGLGALIAALAALFFFLGPTAVDQTTGFADELPATIEELYSWPLVGARLEEWDAVGRAAAFVDDLPSRFGSDAIESFAKRAVGGVVAALTVLLTAVAVLIDGEAVVQRIRRMIPPGRRERADAIGGIVYRSVDFSEEASSWCWPPRRVLSSA